MQVFFICLLGATLLWLFNKLSKEETEVVYYPIEIKYDEKKYVHLQEMPKTISLNLKGSGWQILSNVLRMKSNPLNLSINERIVYNQGYVLTSKFRRSIEKQLEGPSVEEILMDTLSIKLDKKVRKRIYVQANSKSIPLKKDYRIVSDVKISPSLVEVYGPESYLEKIANPYPITLDIPKQSDSFDKEVKIDWGKKYRSYFYSSPEKVHLKCEIDLFLKKKTTLILIPANFPKNSTWKINRKDRLISIEYAYRNKDVGKIRLADFHMIADFRTLNLKDSTVAVQLKTKPAQISKEDIKFEPRVKVIYEED